MLTGSLSVKGVIQFQSTCPPARQGPHRGQCTDRSLSTVSITRSLCALTTHAVLGSFIASHTISLQASHDRK